MTVLDGRPAEPTEPTERPLLVAFASIAWWALLLVVSRIVIVNYDIDPWSFTFVQLMAGGAASIAFSSGGAADWSSLRRFRTWAYGAMRVTTAAAFTAALAHTTVTYAGLLGTTNVVFGVIATAVIFGRRPNRFEYAGHLIIATGVGLLIATRLDGGLRNPAVGLMLISELAVVGASLLAESHPDNAGDHPGVRLRFSGVVLLLTATLFLGLRIAQQGVAGGSLSAAVDASPALWISGIVVGIALRGPAMYVSLAAIRLVGAEVYLMVAASLAFIGLLLETVAGFAGLVDPAAYRPLDAVLIATIAIGAVSVFAIRLRAPAADDRTT